MDAAQKEDLVIAVYRNKNTIFELAYDILCGVEEDLLNFMGNINPVLREDGKTYAYVLVIPYRKGFNSRPDPGFMFPTAFRFHSVNIFTRRAGKIEKTRLKMPSFGVQLIEDFIDDFKVHRGAFSNVLKASARFKPKIDTTRWYAAELFGVNYHDVTEEQYSHQSMIELAALLNRKMKDLGLTIDKDKLRDFLLEHATAIPESEAVEGCTSLEDLVRVRS